MIYSLDIFALCDTQAVLDAVEAELPSIANPIVWATEYEGSTQGTDDNTGYKFIACTIRFNLEADRDIVENAITSLSGILAGCEVGTFIQIHTCGHDDGSDCDATLVYEVI